jgi:hypothetical protein
MTAPTITYGHALLEDAWATLSDDYTLTTGGSTGSMGVTTSTQNLYILITAYVADAYVSNDDNLGISTTVYPKLIVKYKSSSNSKVKIMAEFSDASFQTLVEDATASDYKVGVFTLTTGKTLDHLRFYNTTGTGYTYYDFALVCKGQFTFPQYDRIHYSMNNRYSNVEVASRLGRRKSWCGADEMVVTIDGDIDKNRDGWERPVGTTPKSDYVAAQVLDEIHHNANSELWQWFTCDRGHFKAVMETLEYDENPDLPFTYTYHTVLSEYLLTKGQDFSLVTRLGLALL